MPPQLIHTDPSIAYLFAEAAIRAGQDSESETIMALAEEAAEASHDVLTLASLADMRAISALAGTALPATPRPVLSASGG